MALRPLIFSALAIAVTARGRCISLLPGGASLLQDDATKEGERKRGRLHSLPSLALERHTVDAPTAPVQRAEVLSLQTEDNWRSSNV